MVRTLNLTYRVAETKAGSRWEVKSDGRVVGFGYTTGKVEARAAAFLFCKQRAADVGLPDSGVPSPS